MTHGGNVWHGGAPEDWLDYSANLRPGGPPAWVREVLAAAVDRSAYYPDPAMHSATHALSEYLSLPASHVLPTAGGLSAIDLAVHLDAAGLLVCTPCFAEYAIRGRLHAKPVRTVSLWQGKHQLGLHWDRIASAMVEGCCVWLCNPLNPVGMAFPLMEIQRLLAMVEEKNGFLIVDEAFIAYCPEHSAAALLSAHERLIITGSMTKILGIPGVRLGYLCAQPKVLNVLRPYQLPWELSCFAEAVLCALPAHREEIRRAAQENAQRRGQLQQALESLGAYVYPSEAAFLLADFGQDVQPMVQHLKSQGILVRECTSFDGLDDGCHLRLAVKDEASNQRLIEALKEALLLCAEKP